MCAQRRAFPFANPYLKGTFGPGMNVVSGALTNAASAHLGTGTLMTEIVIVDYEKVPSSFDHPSIHGMPSWTRAEKFMMDNIAWHMVAQINEFGMSARGLMDDLKARMNRGVPVSEFEKHLNQYVGCFLRLGDKESDGFVNMALQTRYNPEDEAQPRILLTFTLTDALPSPILTKNDWPRGEQLFRWLNMGHHAEVTSSLHRGNWICRERAKVMHVYTAELRMPLEEVRMEGAKGLQQTMGEIVEKMVFHLKKVLKICGKGLDLEKMVVFHAWTAWTAGKWVENPFQFLLNYDSRKEFMYLCGDNLVKPSPDGTSRAGQAQWTQVSRIMEQCTTLLQSTWHGDLSQELLWQAWRNARDKCGTAVPVSDTFIGLGTVQAFMRVEGATEAEDDLDWLTSTVRPGPRYEVQFTMKLRRHYFEHLRVGVKTGVGIYACQPNGQSGNDNWMLGNYASQVNMSQNTCFPGLVGQHHKKWWGDSHIATVNTPLEVRKKGVYQLRVEMQHGVGPKKPWNVLFASMLFSSAVDMKLAFEVIMAHMNALAMMRHMENELFDSPYRVHAARDVLKGDSTIDKRPAKSLLDWIYGDTARREGLDTHEYWKQRFYGDLELAPIHYAELVEKNDKKRKQREYEVREEKWKRIRLFQARAGLKPMPHYSYEEVEAMEATAHEEEMLSQMLAAGANQEEQNMGEVRRVVGEQDYDEDDDGDINLLFWNDEQEETEEDDDDDEEEEVTVTTVTTVTETTEVIEEVDDFDNNSVETIE